MIQPQQPTSQEVHGAFIGLNPMALSQDSSKMYPQQSMFSVMQHSSVFAGNIVLDLYQRQKEKIMFLQNVTLGDEEISAALSRLFSRKSIDDLLLYRHEIQISVSK